MSLPFRSSQRRSQQQQPPAMGPPPAYSRIANRISLRPVLVFTTLVSTIYLLVLGVYSLRSLSLSDQTTTIKILDIVVGILLIVAAIIEIFGLVASWTCRLSLAQIYAKISTLALLLVVGADLIEIISHFVNKSDLISGCTSRNTGESESSSSIWSIFGQGSDDDNDEPMTSEEAGIYCKDLWRREAIWEFVWLLIAIIFGGIFIFLAFSFVRQLQDPSIIRSNQQSAAAAAAGYSSAFTEDQHDPFIGGGEGPNRYDGSSPSPNPGYYDSTNPFSYPPPSGPPLPLARAGSSRTDSAVPTYEQATASRKGGGMMSIDLDRKEGASSEAHGTGGGYSGMYDEEGGQERAWQARDEEESGSSNQPSSPPLGGREEHRGV